jgi:hypothetical protein
MPRGLATVAVALLAARAAAVEPQVDRGNVLVYKELRAPETNDVLVVGKPFTVTYHVFNMGKGDAIDVNVKEEFPADSFEFVAGASEKTWAVLAGCVSSVRAPRRAAPGGVPRAAGGTREAG